MIAFIALYFILIIFFSFFKTPKIENAIVNLFKALCPSWKFFDESIDTPVLLFRLINENEWKICINHPRKRWFHILYNPQGNFYLAYHSHIQQLLGDLDQADDLTAQQFHQHVSYKICENFVRSMKPSSDFQFKISSIELNEQGLHILDDILISPVLKKDLE